MFKESNTEKYTFHLISISEILTALHKSEQENIVVFYCHFNNDKPTQWRENTQAHTATATH